MKRRDFLKYTSLTTSAVLVPSFLKAFEIPQNFEGKKLVIIQFSGGNDGLNTFVPYQNDLYYQYRPKVALSKDEILKVHSEIGFHPALQQLRSLYDEGYVSIINEVGYPNPNRSHFRSMDIWHTASEAQEYKNNGWLGRYLDAECTAPHMAIEMSQGLSLALKGDQLSGMAVPNLNMLQKTIRSKHVKYINNNHKGHSHNAHVDFMYKTLASTYSSTNYLNEKIGKVDRSSSYPQTQLGKQLQDVASFIKAGAKSKVYYATHNGFDTHVYQKNKHQQLLGQFDEAVGTFVQDLKKSGQFDNTLVVVFSEFGRRVKENGSAGTDHGTANNMIIIGNQLKKAGFYNQETDLVNLDSNGDLQYSVDFRDVYATLLDKWLDTKHDQILGGKRSPLAFI
ncbi:DUF1501 domain-containing protein [Sediminitomix flava]|uniref:Uncharacterized protein (DUF1501 family) n=1 Tax=Sediminitomix flava TaxID=379075 RepID=A0A315ZCF1_SEDFL|nr:DUF1501 domain-containing protein [Sediminitomix flava]PWJ43256.1 uncharacterized protein (DUF1501 family) [Sediminitomix flava]